MDKKQQIFNKEDIVDKIWGHNNVNTKVDAEMTLEIIFNNIIQRVKEGRKVSIAGFGMFKSKVRKARQCRNPRTGEIISIPQMTVVSFTPSNKFKYILRESDIM